MTTRRRNLPPWLKSINKPVLDNEVNIGNVLSSAQGEYNDTITEKRYRTRSSAPITKPEEKKIEPSKPKPFIVYNGKVEYATEMIDIACMSDILLAWVNEHKDEKVPIAFDMEWPFTFQTGSGRTAVIQLCADINLCYIFHVHDLKKMPAVLVALLKHDKVVLHGVNIKNDLRKLERDFPEVKTQKMIDQCVDLGVYCNDVMATGGRWSMANLVSYICNLQINKDRKVRMSQWHIKPLTAEQQIYAAIDVYISQVIYYELKRRDIEKENDARQFIEEHGKEAFDAVQKLM